MFGDPSGLAPEPIQKGGVHFLLEEEKAVAGYTLEQRKAQRKADELHRLSKLKVAGYYGSIELNSNSLTMDDFPQYYPYAPSSDGSGSGSGFDLDVHPMLQASLRDSYASYINRHMYGEPAAAVGGITPAPNGCNASRAVTSSGGSTSTSRPTANSGEFDYDEVKARVFEFTHDWNTINKLEHAADLINLFNYYLANPSLDGEVYKENFLFLKCLAHYQNGENKPLWVDANTIDLGEKKPKKEGRAGANLFSFSDADLSAIDNFANFTDEALALGKIDILVLENSMMLFADTYDFNIESSVFDINNPQVFIRSLMTSRNLGNSISWLLHNVPFLMQGDGGFDIYFKGEISR